MKLKKLATTSLILMLSVVSEAQYNLWHMMNSNASINTPYSATLTLPQVSSLSQVQTDVCFTVNAAIKNVFGSTIKASSALSLPISAGSGVSLYSDAGCTTAASNLSVPAGSGTGTFYMKYTFAAVSSAAINVSLNAYIPGKTSSITATFNRPINCLDALNKGYRNSSGAQTTSGTYLIDPDGAGSISPMYAYCMMDTSPAYANLMRGATLVGAMNANDGAISYVSSIASLPTSGSSQALANNIYQTLLNQSSYLWFLTGGSAGVNIRVPRGDLSRMNYNNNLSSLCPVNYTSASCKSTVSSSPHNAWVYSDYGDNGNYSFISVNSSTAYLYHGSPGLSYNQPYYRWTGSTFQAPDWSTGAIQMTKNAGELLYIWVY